MLTAFSIIYNTFTQDGGENDNSSQVTRLNLLFLPIQADHLVASGLACLLIS